jgi:uncharacterized repeat protein (TIGR03803 family)
MGPSSVKLRTPGARIASRLLTLCLLISSVAWAGSRYQVLHAFGKRGDGGGVWCRVVLDPKGNLYGTTSGGGTGNQGVVFELSPRPDGKWTEEILHNFPSFPNDGQGPTDYGSGLILDPAGHLYGTTLGGGPQDIGTVFELTRSASRWKETLVHGGGSWAGLAEDEGGNLYGTQETDVFELQPTEHGWVRTILHNFRKRGDGGGAFAPVILDSAGNLYGTTEGGGAYGGGTVYEVERTADGWKEKLLHSFAVNYKDGHTPGLGALVMDNAGALYGTTAGGGCCGGVIFKLTPGSDGSWKETIIYDFKGGALGFEAGGGVVMDKAGKLYGTTINGGSGGCGVVYELAPTSSGKWKYTVLHAFQGNDGCQPDANMILDDKGNLYGTTATGGTYIGGVVFELTP